MRSVVLIPARMESTRFPNKPLAKILDKPMIQWVYEAVDRSKATDVFIVTDSEEIMKAAEGFDASCIATGSHHANGTERCVEALEILDPDLSQYDVIINVQGDEPLINPKDINALLELFEEDEVDIATLITNITEEEEYLNPNVVKAVPTLFNDDFCDILYFSRSPIPHMQKFEEGMAFKHIGVYAFTATAFQEIQSLEPSPYEVSERLEQLRWVQNHLVVSAYKTSSTLIGVDSESDLRAVENFLTSDSKR